MNNSPELSGARLCACCKERNGNPKEFLSYKFFICDLCDPFMKRVYEAMRYAHDSSDPDAEVFDYIWADMIGISYEKLQELKRDRLG